MGDETETDLDGGVDVGEGVVEVFLWGAGVGGGAGGGDVLEGGDGGAEDGGVEEEAGAG